MANHSNTGRPHRCQRNLMDPSAPSHTADSVRVKNGVPPSPGQDQAAGTTRAYAGLGNRHPKIVRALPTRLNSRLRVALLAAPPPIGAGGPVSLAKGPYRCQRTPEPLYAPQARCFAEGPPTQSPAPRQVRLPEPERLQWPLGSGRRRESGSSSRGICRSGEPRARAGGLDASLPNAEGRQCRCSAFSSPKTPPSIGNGSDTIRRSWCRGPSAV